MLASLSAFGTANLRASWMRADSLHRRRCNEVVLLLGGCGSRGHHFTAGGRRRAAGARAVTRVTHEKRKASVIGTNE